MGLQTLAKSWLNHKIETPKGYLSALRLMRALVRRPMFWNSARLVWRLASLEKLAFWNMTEWSADPEVQKGRERFMLDLRELLSAMILTPSSWEDRRRINRLLSRLEFELQTQQVYCYPWRVNFEMSSKCNLRCPMCPQSILDFERDLTSPEILEHVRSLFPWLEVIDLTGFGEPLLNPLLITVLSELGEHTHTRMITNGILLSEELGRAFIEHRLRELTVSIDAASAEVYKQQRGSNRFDHILDNIRGLAQLKREARSDYPCLSFNFVMMQSNCRELPDAIRLAAKLGMERLSASYLSVYRSDMKEQSLYYDKQLANDLIDEGMVVAEQEGVVFIAPPKFAMKEPEAYPSPQKCPDPWEFMMLKADAKAAVCCLSAAVFGDLCQQDVIDIWRSGGYDAFRGRVNSVKNPPLMCRSCVYGRATCVDDPSMHFYYKQVEAVVKSDGAILD
jgi:MoaA/NifB/PqqE/SkfB family radical SAM enzyme